MNSNIFLIGYRGTGKTTVGAILAARLGWTYVDADPFLEAKHGKSIRQMFANEGEPVFRDRETEVLAELAGRTHHVISTGGGVILRDVNRAVIATRGWTVWLTADAETIARRLADDPTTGERRPRLTKGGLDEIQELLAVREPLYRSCADLEIDSSERSPEALVEAILSAWNSSGSKSSG